MRFLIDTQILIWHYEGNLQMPKKAIHIIENEANSLCVSIASFWEMAIKICNGKMELTSTLDKWIEQIKADEIDILLVEPSHILTLMTLPLHHKDPFDRIIISQAITENLTVISSDHVFSQYPISLL